MILLIAVPCMLGCACVSCAQAYCTTDLLHDVCITYQFCVIYNVVCFESLISGCIQSTFFTKIGQPMQLIEANVSGSQPLLHLQGCEVGPRKAKAMQCNKDWTSRLIWVLLLSTHTLTEQSWVLSLLNLGCYVLRFCVCLNF